MAPVVRVFELEPRICNAIGLFTSDGSVATLSSQPEDLSIQQGIFALQ